MAQEITTYDEVSTIDKNTKLLLTKDGGLGQKSIEEVGNVINGTGDISGIGDGTVKGAIRGLNDEIFGVTIKEVNNKTQASNSTLTYKMSVEDFKKYTGVNSYLVIATTWSTTPTQTIAIVTISGGNVSNVVVSKLAGSDQTITANDGIISATNCSKLSVFAL